MSEALFLGHTTKNDRVFLNPNDLTTHGVVVGRTGSGKTGLIHVLIEEAVMSGASAVVLDPKGDLTNLMLSFPGLTPEEFSPWVPEGKSPEDEALRWIKGLRDSDQDVSRVAQWHEAADVTVYTPGLVSGQSVNLLPNFDPPGDGNKREKANHVVTTVLSAIGIDGDPMVDPSHVFLTELLLDAWNSGESLPLEKWSGLIVTPPDSLHDIDGISIEDFFHSRERMKLARSIVGFRRQAARWLEGTPLEIGSFLNTCAKPKLSIFTLRHLNYDDRMLFTSMFLSRLVDWIYQSPASENLKALCVLDEASGYLPPHPFNPPTKRPITTLLAQGRAHGLGIIVGTQNPNDLDYKALSNVGTWFLGGLRDRDVKRDLESELRERDIDPSSLLTLPERSFLFLSKNGDSKVLKTRWTLSYLRGPIDASQLSRSGSKIGDVYDLDFELIDASARPLDIAVRYSVDGITWHDATPTSNTPPSHGLKSSTTGVAHRFSWDSAADLGFVFVSNVRLALHVEGSGTLDVPPFDVNNELERV